MAYGTYPSPSDSHSPSASTSVSPESNNANLDPITSNDDDTSGQSSTSGTPSRSTASLPRSQSAGKGGCWTCRVRRKKCDEQREGDSCKTCRRLTIKCLGWGAKRPEWMREKKSVDGYKASIKAQLSRAGLIRGQPRHNPMNIPAQRTHHPRSTSNPVPIPTPPPVTITHPEFQNYGQFTDSPYAPSETSLMTGMPGGSNPSFDQLSTTSFNDLNLHTFDQGIVYPYSPASISSASSYGMVDPLLDSSFNLFPQGTDMLSYSEPQTTMGGSYAGLAHSPMYEDLVIHYFNVVSKIQFIFAGNQLSEITYNTVMHEPRGAPSYAIYALADLHLTQMRISQGLEAPQSSQASTAHYMYQEALFKLKSNRDNGNGWGESDAIAALHLVSYSHLAGGRADWQEPFEILCAWLLQSNLSLAGENTRMIFDSMSVASQLLVKLIMWLDIFSSLSFVRPPKFLNIWRSLLDNRNGTLASLDMASLTGCPDDTFLAIANISALAQWKATQVRNSTLSIPELVAKGMKIQEFITQHRAVEPEEGYATLEGLREGEAPGELHRAASVAIFRESALLYLHTILSNSTPGVTEITASVSEVVRRLTQIQPSNLDRALVFPICLAGCMTNDSNNRDYLKSRLQGLNESYGNLLQTRLLMEAVWHRRDVSGEMVDLRETMREKPQLMVLLL